MVPKKDQLSMRGIKVQSFYKYIGWLPVRDTELNIGEIMVS